MHDDVDLTRSDAEEPMRLDDFEPLVHQRRRVDRDLRAHPPRRVAQGVVGGDVRQARGRKLAEWTTGGGEDQPPDVTRVAAVRALVDGVVFAVDREHGHTAAAGAFHDDRAGHHQDFLVGERDGLATVNRRQHRVERRRPRRREEDDVGVGVCGNGNQPFRPAGGGRRERSALPAKSGLHLGETSGRRHRDSIGGVLRHLFGQPRHVLAGRERDDAEPLGMSRDDGEGALADRPGRSEDGDALHDACR